MNHRLICLCMAICFAWIPQSAWAILNSCDVSASGVSFSYDPSNPSPTVSTGTVIVSCFGILGGGLFEVWLSTGQSGSYTARIMNKGADTLSYNLYTNSGHTTVWGDGTGGTGFQSVNCLPLLCLGLPNVFTVYGRIPAQQNVPAGTYSDTITVTVSF